VQGRPLVAYRLGTGPIKVVLVGDIHGAYELNTHLLVPDFRSELCTLLALSLHTLRMDRSNAEIRT
jgi:hypothetical protein